MSHVELFTEPVQGTNLIFQVTLGVGGRKKERETFNIVLKQNETLESFQECYKNKKDAKPLHHHLTSYPEDSQEQQRFFAITFQPVQRTAMSSGYTWLEMLLPILCYSLPPWSKEQHNQEYQRWKPLPLTAEHPQSPMARQSRKDLLLCLSPAWGLCVTEAHKQARGHGAAKLWSFMSHQWTQQCFLSGCTCQLHPRYIKGYVYTYQTPLFPKSSYP